MDWFLYDNGLCLERVNINFYDKDEKILESPGQQQLISFIP